MNGSNGFAPTIVIWLSTTAAVTNRLLPRLEDLPIPQDVQVGRGWHKVMRDIAEVVGPHAALSIAEESGGREIYFSANPRSLPFYRAIGRRAATKLSRHYRGERIIIPLAKAAVSMARRASLIAAVRNGDISAGDAAQIIGTRRDYLSRILASGEGVGVLPLALPVVRNGRILREAAGVAQEVLNENAVASDVIEEVRNGILALGRCDLDVRVQNASEETVEGWVADANERRAAADATGGSLVEAYAYMSLAADAGSPAAREAVLDMGDEMSRQQRVFARNLARKILIGRLSPEPFPLSETTASPCERNDHD